MALTIGMFTDTYLPEINGVVTSLASTAHGLRRRGHRVIVVAPAHDGVAGDDPDIFRFRSTAFPFYPELRMAFPFPAKLLAALPRMPFDIIHAHSFFFVGCLGAYLAQLRRIPLFFTYHTRWTEFNHYSPMNPRIGHAQAVWLSREFCNRCDHVIAPTHAMADVLHSFGVETAIDVIPSGVDLQEFSGNTAPVQTSRPREGRGLLYVGRLAKEKNLDTLLDAFAILATAVRDVRLVIVGGGPYEQHLRQRAATMANAEQIEFTGPLERSVLGSYYDAADLFVFTSKTETQGLVVIEAMAHGLPVVAVECPIIGEIVSRRAGVLVADEPVAIAQAAAALLQETADQRATRAAAAREDAAPYSLDTVVDRLLELYQTAGSSRAARV